MTKRKQVAQKSKRAQAAGKKPIGRPSGYKPEYARVAAKLCKLGATDPDLAEAFGVNTTTIWRWTSAHEDFCNALKVGKAHADDKVERSLFQKAVGYTYDSEKVFQFQGDVVRAQTREHVPPDTTACIFWLKNRRRDEWRDKLDHEHTGRDGGPIETREAKSLTDDELLSIALRGSTGASAPKGSSRVIN